MKRIFSLQLFLSKHKKFGFQLGKVKSHNEILYSLQSFIKLPELICNQTTKFPFSIEKNRQRFKNENKNCKKQILCVLFICRAY